MAGAIRVSAGRKSVEPGLASALTARNHMLDEQFEAKTLVMKEKKKKKTEDDSDQSDDEIEDDDGYLYTERVGVSAAYIQIGRSLLTMSPHRMIQLMYLLIII